MLFEYPESVLLGIGFLFSFVINSMAKQKREGSFVDFHAIKIHILPLSLY